MSDKNTPSLCSYSFFYGTKIARNDYVFDRLGNLVHSGDTLTSLGQAFALAFRNKTPTFFVFVENFQISQYNNRALTKTKLSEYPIYLEQTFLIKLCDWSFLDYMKIFAIYKGYIFADRVCRVMDKIRSFIVSGSIS